MYQKPKQSRAIETEQRFLDAFNRLLVSKSYGKLTIDDIADQAGLHRGAFLKRFGSKKQALMILWEQYCDQCSIAMQEMIHSLHDSSASLEDTCTEISRRLEQLQLGHFSANRAINEHFMEDLEVAEPTKEAFRESVEMMRCVQRKFLKGTHFSDAGAFAAAQLLLTINYNYVIRAMPALPMDAEIRHRLIGKVVLSALMI